MGSSPAKERHPFPLMSRWGEEDGSEVWRQGGHSWRQGKHDVTGNMSVDINDKGGEC